MPASPEGRIFASILILLDIAMKSLITANLLARNTENELRFEQPELKKHLQPEARMQQMEQKN